MANPFGGFNVTSPLASHPHNPVNDLASNCIRDYFGPTCQTVFDCLNSRGKSTLQQLNTAIRTQCKRDINPERLRLVDNLIPFKGRNGVKINMARGSEEKGYVVDSASIRAALIVLLQHSMIRAFPPPKAMASDDSGASDPAAGVDAKNMKFRYAVDVERALLLPRYPRYIEYAKKNYQEEGALIIEEILVYGRMLTEEIIEVSTEGLNSILNEDEDEDDNADNEEENEAAKSENVLALSVKVIDSLMKMIDDGFIEMVEPIDAKIQNKSSSVTPSAIPDEQQNGLSANTKSKTDSSKKRSFDEISSQNNIHNNTDNVIVKGDSDNANATASSNASTLTLHIRSMLGMNKYKRTFPLGAVWRLNIDMFHASIRAFYIGRLVAERYGNDKSFGAIMSAALKYLAAKEHSPKLQSQSNNPDDNIVEASFTPDDIMPYLTPAVLADFKNKAGGARSNLSSVLVALTQFTYPQVLAEVEEAQGHALGGKFEVTLRQTMAYLKGVMLHKVVKDHYGDVASRICSILQAKGHLESDTIADSAMVPAKDARELLHRLYKANYISLFYLQQTKQHNPANAIYLWFVDSNKMEKTVLWNSCRALYNMRLRRQHEVEVGKDWIERAKEAGGMDENESELDKLNYNKFCQGLERLDNACLQLDEILMLLKHFDK